MEEYVTLGAMETPHRGATAIICGPISPNTVGSPSLVASRSVGAAKTVAAQSGGRCPYYSYRSEDTSTIGPTVCKLVCRGDTSCMVQHMCHLPRGFSKTMATNISPRRGTALKVSLSMAARIFGGSLVVPDLLHDSITRLHREAQSPDRHGELNSPGYTPRHSCSVFSLALRSAQTMEWVPVPERWKLRPP